MKKIILNILLFFALQYLNAAPPLLIVDITNPTNCTGANGGGGTIILSAFGGTPPYLFTIGTGLIFTGQTVYTDLKPGHYYVGVVDAKGFSDNSIAVLPPPYKFDFSTLVTDATCFDEFDGKIKCNPTNGVGPFEFKHSANSFSQWPNNTITGLQRGTNKSIWGKDANGCISDKKTVTIGSPDKLILLKSTITPATKLLGNTSRNDGIIELNVQGGTSPYRFELTYDNHPWPWRFNTNGVFNGLVPTTNFSNINYYYGRVIDSKNCRASTIGLSVPNITKRRISSEKKSYKINEEINDKFNNQFVTLTPNPTVNQFLIKINTSKKENINIRVFDTNGKTIYATKGLPEQTYRFGESFAPGVYLVEVRQGDEVKTVKAIKH